MFRPSESESMGDGEYDPMDQVELGGSLISRVIDSAHPVFLRGLQATVGSVGLTSPLWSCYPPSCAPGPASVEVNLTNCCEVLLTPKSPHHHHHRRPAPETRTDTGHGCRYSSASTRALRVCARCRGFGFVGFA